MRTKKYGQGGTALSMQANQATKDWRTPSDISKRGGSQSPDKRKAGGHAVNLEDQAEHWPTPMAGSPGTDSYSAAGNSDFSRRAMALAEGIGTDGETPGVALTEGSRLTRGGARSSELLLTGQAVELSEKWPTPLTADDGRKVTPRTAQNQLCNVASAWPDESSRPDQPMQPGQKYSETRRSLNPLFVEWLMGWPIGWTDCAPVETGLSRWLQQSRGYLSTLLSLRTEQNDSRQGSLF